MEYGMNIISEKSNEPDSVLTNYNSIHFIEIIDINNNFDELIQAIEIVKNKKQSHIENLQKVTTLFKEDIHDLIKL